jgi:uncharacterized lipoprotein YajG
MIHSFKQEGTLMYRFVMIAIGLALAGCQTDSQAVSAGPQVPTTGSVQCDQVLSELNNRDNALKAQEATYNQRPTRKGAVALAARSQDTSAYFKAALPHIPEACNRQMAQAASAEVTQRIAQIDTFVASVR